MESRFQDFQTLAHFQACIDNSYSTSSRNILSRAEKEKIKKHLSFIEKALKEKKYEEVKSQLTLLNQFLNDIARKIASNRIRDDKTDKTVLDLLVKYRDQILNHITNYLIERTPDILPQVEVFIPKDIVDARKQIKESDNDHALNFDPLQKMSERYKALEVGHSLSLDSVKLHGLSIAEGESLFDYLHKKSGYDIKAQRDSSDDFTWKGKITLKKNTLATFDLPLHYNGILTDFCTHDTTTPPSSVVQYTPNLTLLKFQAHIPASGKVLSCKRFNDILKKHQTTASIFKFLDSTLRNLYQLTEKHVITEMDIQNALRWGSAHRFNLFVTENEKPNNSATDRIICEFRRAFH